MFKHRVMGLVSMFAIVLAVGVAGCGGGDDETTSTEGSQAAVVTVQTTSMPVAEYTKKANTTCVQELEEMLGLVQKAIRTNSPVPTKSVLPPLESMLTELTALGAPEAEKAEVEAFLNALNEDLEEAKEISSEKVTLRQLAEIFQESADIAAKLKLAACELS